MRQLVVKTESAIVALSLIFCFPLTNRLRPAPETLIVAHDYSVPVAVDRKNREAIVLFYDRFVTDVIRYVYRAGDDLYMSNQLFFLTTLRSPTDRQVVKLNPLRIAYEIIRNPIAVARPGFFTRVQ